MASANPPRLDPSELGTKEYWDTTYTTDLTTHATNRSHTGTTWFADASASSKVLSYLLSPALSLSLPTTTFLDLGTGNGEMLFLLRAKGGFRGRMLGVDYSGASVELARAVAGEEGVGGGGGGGGDVEFRRWDALGAEELEGGWDVVLDKGTFDAVGLMGVEGVEARYVERVRGLVGRGGRVVVTSCNWTEGEVRAWFEGGGGEEEGELVFEGRVEYPRFRFGGLEGQSVCSVCFRKR